MAFKMKKFSGFKQIEEDPPIKGGKRDFSPRFHGFSEERIADIREKENLRTGKGKTGGAVEDVTAEKPKEKMMEKTFKEAEKVEEEFPGEPKEEKKVVEGKRPISKKIIDVIKYASPGGILHIGKDIWKKVKKKKKKQE